MKDKLSITIGRETHLRMKERMRAGLFRSKSRFIEYVLMKFLENETKNE